MKKILLFFILIIIPEITFSHPSHYNEFKKIEMEIFKDGKKIGYSIYEFAYKENTLEVVNKTEFEVKLLGVKIFSIKSNGVEKYYNDKLVSFFSKTYQNDKEKFVQLKFNKEDQVYEIKGSSFTGNTKSEHVIGNWWNHKILLSETQISPLSGSIKDQVVTFVEKEIINIYGKEYLVDKFSIKSKDETLNEDKKLNFNVWFEPKSKLILKVEYNRMGNWIYILKNTIMR